MSNDNIRLARSLEAVATLIASDHITQRQADSSLRQIARALRAGVTPEIIGQPIADQPINDGVNRPSMSDPIQTPSVARTADTYGMPQGRVRAARVLSSQLQAMVGEATAKRAQQVDALGAFQLGDNEIEIVYHVCPEHGPQGCIILVNSTEHTFLRMDEETVDAFNKRIHAHFAGHLGVAAYVAEQIRRLMIQWQSRYAGRVGQTKG